jgi:hypothetical protein
VRIKRVDPRWDGVFVPVVAEVREDEQATAKKTPGKKSAIAGVIIASQILDSVGQSSPEQLDYAIDLINEIPQAIGDAVHEPYGARAVIYCLVINSESDVRDRQLQQLKGFADTGIYDLVSSLLVPVKALGIRFRLPLIDMALPALRQLSAAQYERFNNNLQFLMQADHRIDLFEWSLQKILSHHLAPAFDRPGARAAQFGSLHAVKEHVNVLMSMLTHACVQDKAQVTAAIAGAEKELGMKLELLPRENINMDTLGVAVDKLSLLQPLLKPRLLKACLILITQDQEYSASEMELMRAIASVLDCPVPPYRSFTL